MHVVIIGNGIAGTNAARHLRKAGEARITIISDEAFEPFSRTALMYIFMGHLRLSDTWLYEKEFWKKNRINRIQTRVSAINTDQKTLTLANNETLVYDKLIIATGSLPNTFGWPGQDAKGVSGLYHLKDLDAVETYGAKAKSAVVVGGGLIGIELTEMLHSRGVAVTFLVREKSFWDIVLPKEESEMINRHIREHGIDLRLETELKAIVTDADNKARAVLTASDQEIACTYVGLAVGVRPNIDFLKNSGIACKRGVLVNEFLATSAPDVYAIGDCAELQNPLPGRRAIEAIWYTGRMMGQTVAATLSGIPTPYVPKRWFNAAKFFDIEYQAYGDVPAQLPPHTKTFFWQHSEGRKSVRINYNADNEAVTGFVLMGIRYRHEVCDSWLATETSLETVMKDLRLANFDPEFFKQYEPQIIHQYNLQSGKAVRLSAPRSLSWVTRFLKNNK